MLLEKWGCQCVADDPSSPVRKSNPVVRPPSAVTVVPNSAEEAGLSKNNAALGHFLDAGDPSARLALLAGGQEALGVLGRGEVAFEQPGAHRAGRQHVELHAGVGVVQSDGADRRAQRPLAGGVGAELLFTEFGVDAADRDHRGVRGRDHQREQ